jgi:hypothetical protein
MKYISTVSIALTLLLAPCDGSTQIPLFESPAAFITEKPNNSMCVADFNNDGVSDVVVSATSGIWILFGRGDGTFAERQQRYWDHASTIVAGDFDGDGTQDVVFTAPEEYTTGVVVLFDIGSEGYSGATLLSTTGDIPVVAGGDLNGDGIDDVVALYGGTNELRIYFSQGDKSFAPAASYGGADVPRSALIRDLDNDGDSDIAATGDGSEDDVFIYLNGGDGTLLTPVPYDVGANPNSIDGEDLDGDGDIDLAIAADAAYVLFNNGDGSFSTAIGYSTGDDPSSVCAEDFDNDGDGDLLLSNYATDEVAYLQNNGDGTFMSPVHYRVGAHPGVIFADDFDGDSDCDIAVSSGMSNDVWILNNIGDGTFLEAPTYGSGKGLDAIRANDLNGDGFIDLAFAQNYTEVSILHGDGFGAFTPGAAYVVGFSPSSLDSDDLDGDGDIDLVTVNRNDFSVLLNAGTGDFAPAVNYSIGDGSIYDTHEIEIYDLDGDGDSDLVVTNRQFDNVSVFLNDGTGTFGPSVDYSYNANSYPRRIFAADLDDDGDGDLAVAHADRMLVILLNNGDGTFVVSAQYDLYTNTIMCVFGSDFDGDHDIDLAVVSTYGLQTLANIGDGTFQNPIEYYGLYNHSGGCAADLDGDGDNDIAVVNWQYDHVTLFANRGDGIFENVVRYGTGDGPGDVCAADFDRDGDYDLAVTNKTENPNIYDGNVSVLLNCTNDMTTPVSFQAFDAVFEAGSVILRWVTGMEDDIRGFHVLRSQSHDGIYTRVTRGLIDSQGGIRHGFSYEYCDNAVLPGRIYYYKLEEISGTGASTEHGPWSVVYESTDNLAQNIPNPFNPETTIRFSLARESHVHLAIYDASGRLVRILLDSRKSPNIYKLNWDGRNENGQRVASGVYFYRIKAGKFTETRKMLLLK